MKHKESIWRSFAVWLFILTPAANGSTYILPPENIDLIGLIRNTTVGKNETIADIAFESRVGQNEIMLANPTADRWAPAPDSTVILPTRYILPDAERQGIVLNLPEFRLYYYWQETRKHQELVSTYPVSIGRQEWQTPLGSTRIISKVADPDWIPPESIKLEAEANGRPLPDIIPAGPNNPLGQFALRLNLPGYLLHGTSRPMGIGMRVTHGCVRLYPEDIETLFKTAPLQTQVAIINQPVKVGWFADQLYLEVHPPLDEDAITDSELMETAVTLISKKLGRTSHSIRSSLVRQTVSRKSGIPVLLSRTDLQW